MVCLYTVIGRLCFVGNNDCIGHQGNWLSYQLHFHIENTYKHLVYRLINIFISSLGSVFGTTEFLSIKLWVCIEGKRLEKGKLTKTRKNERKFQWEFVIGCKYRGNDRPITITITITVFDHNNGINCFIITGHITSITIISYINWRTHGKTENYLRQFREHLLFGSNDSWHHHIELQTKEKNPR